MKLIISYLNLNTTLRLRFPCLLLNSVITIQVTWPEKAWCKSGTRTPRPRTSGPWDPPWKFKRGTPGLPSKFKSGTPSPFFNEFIFFRIFHRFLSLFLFWKRCIQKNINCELTLVRYIWKRKNYLKKLKSTPVNSNPIEVIILFDCHRLAILSEVYL